MEITSSRRRTAWGIFPIGVKSSLTCMCWTLMSMWPSMHWTFVFSCIQMLADCPVKAAHMRRNLSRRTVLCSCFRLSDSMYSTDFPWQYTYKSKFRNLATFTKSTCQNDATHLKVKGQWIPFMCFCIYRTVYGLGLTFKSLKI